MGSRRVQAAWWLVLCLLFYAVGFVYAEDDEFLAWDASTEGLAGEEARACGPAETPSLRPHALYAKYGAVGLSLLFAVMGGLVLRIRRGFFLRPLVLLVSMASLGFMMGACPCMIKGVQTPLAWLGGNPQIHWIPLLGVLALIPLTMILGPVFCGWACPLGALQEFLHQGKNRAAHPSSRVTHGFRWGRRVAGILLAAWLLSTGVIFWEQVDPFRSIFNLHASTWAAMLLAIILLLASLYVYRPFCRMLCPLGLVLGWVARLPFAARPQMEASCVQCGRCVRVCGMGALDQQNRVDMELCIGCGKCVESCGPQAIAWRSRKGNRQ